MANLQVIQFANLGAIGMTPAVYVGHWRGFKSLQSLDSTAVATIKYQFSHDNVNWLTGGTVAAGGSDDEFASASWVRLNVTAWVSGSTACILTGDAGQ
jgi:hypothetical protein